MDGLTSKDEKLAEPLRVLGSLAPDEVFAPLLTIIEQARARAYAAVNRELVGMYWDIGAYISGKVDSDGWGQGVVREFSAWIQRRILGIGGFSPQNVWRMKQLYETYRGNEKLSPLVSELPWSSNLHELTDAADVEDDDEQL